ncbi:hypothetical protein VPHD479_0036 [Vibrio phage D479]
MTTATMANLEAKANALLSGDNKLGIDLKSKGWKFEWSNTSRTLGDCWGGRKLIRLSKKLINARSYEEQVNTLTHELAHAIDHTRRGTSDHSNIWRQIHLELGGDGQRCSSISKPEAAPAKYVVYFQKDDGSIEYICGYQKMTRKIQNISQSWMPGRKAETMGKLKVVTGTEYARIKALSENKNVVVAPKAAPKTTEVNTPAPKPAPKAVVKPAKKTTGKTIMTPEGEFTSIYAAAKALGSYYSVIKGRVESSKNSSYYYL